VLRSQIFKSLTKLVFNNFRTFELMISTSLIQVTDRMNDLDLEATKSINQNLTLPKAFEQEKKRVFGANGGKR
jgi:hypothetical protein